MSKKKDKRERARARRPQEGTAYAVRLDMHKFFQPIKLEDATAALRSVVEAANQVMRAEREELRSRMLEKVYISGAIAHYDLKERMAAFGKAEKELAARGYYPVNPFKNGLPQSADWRQHMRRDIGLLLDCKYIYMLKGWELSKGAKLELDVASTCGIKVMFE